ncbi:lectin-like protein [Verrucomicrobiales bacterium BCK34]|nr:lectin-like protein [Verrucomicrobiales bacterium BCK34]
MNRFHPVFQRPVSLSILPVIVLSALICAQSGYGRTWTNQNGQTAEGKVVKIEGSEVTLLLNNDQAVAIPINTLSLDDQQFLTTWKPKPPKRPIEVPEDAVFHNGSWYAVVIGKTTWKKAAERAEKMGGHLAWIKDEATHAVLTEMAGPLHLWLGGSDEEVEDLWKWSDGELITWFQWDRGEPNNGGGREHFIQMRAGGKWNDLSMNSPAPVGFFVQWDQ